MNQQKTKWIRISFIVSVILLIIKFYSFYITNSLAILTDALESIVNVVAAGFASYSIYLSSQPKDENHPYGHGKIEFFSAGIEGVLIILAGLFIIYQAIYNFFVPNELEMLLEGVFLIGITGLINGLLGLKLKNVGRKMNSITLEANGKHLLTDTVSSLILVGGVVVIYLTGIEILDAILSILFSLYIVYSGYILVRKSVGGLMDEANPLAISHTVSVLNSERKPEWIDIHNMRVQQYGSDRHIDLHLTLPYYFELKRVHEEVEKVEEALENTFHGGMEVFIHSDPCIPEKCCKYCQLSTCSVRKYKASTKIEWTAENMAKNQKHYHELTDRITD
ncbi:cation diffusion facilitator family transporter [Belliella kenyensis]|uniref:Cation diffusion facilitator family transporter n=1 Tax=Belliella kenyensis TaxID=1472724 RepID=A0ABV8EK64_9BACT|nr:cation diffusion facilitator family transporter [Belliella kenyensis]MCH7402986.1 cation diffusion facilitator family transporter [Belliella kenyensis]MDN3605022.1 cation diffusion facilitator family transporter [Belliella kenyensis]